jgi:signal transduction histidine kinase
VRGAFLVLTEGQHVHLVGGAHRLCNDDAFPEVQFLSRDSSWLRNTGSSLPIWLRLFQQTIAIDASSGSATRQVFSTSDVNLNHQFSGNPEAPNPPIMSFYAGTPLPAHNGQNVGVLFVVDNAKSELSAFEANCLASTAKQIMNLLHLAQERTYYRRWKVIQKQLDLFIHPRSFQTTEREELHGATGKMICSPNLKVEPRPIRDDFSTVESPVRTDEEHVEGSLKGNMTENARTLKAGAGVENSSRESSETIYRNIFRRASQSLRLALEADGVLFADSLTGLHGDIQPAAEPALELEIELDQTSRDGVGHALEVSASLRGESPHCGSAQAQSHEPDQESESRINTRTYTSPEYRKRIYVMRPTEVLGLAGDTSQLNLMAVSRSTTGISSLEEESFDRMVQSYPDGAVWYITDTAFTQIRDGIPVEIDNQEDGDKLRSAFPHAKQMMFKPVVDPVSSKLLGACFVWKNETSLLFSEVSDLASLTTFLHEVESEVARYDTINMVHQRETFVTSVSHELSELPLAAIEYIAIVANVLGTPLHGVLGAVQLLDLSDLDSLQHSLAEIINTCGSTLHETLTSVLSYAKINQLERGQNTYKYKNPAGSGLAHPNARRNPSDPDIDSKDLYVRTNLAMLCEEIVGVLEAGRSFQRETNGETIVICDIDYADNWSYYTEPGSLRRIAINLIGNALRYTDSGSVIVTLKVSDLLKDNGTLEDSSSDRKLNLGVRDTGRGMSKDFMDNHLFIPFTQEDPTSSTGVGLGMSIVKSLVSLLGGEINVHSQVGSGTDVDVKVPITNPDSQGEDEGSATREFEENIDILRARRLAVVIFGFPDFVKRSLKGYLETWYGCVLLDPTQDARPDIVILDEGNPDVLDSVKFTAPAYSLRAVLLSIVMVPRYMGKKMDNIRGYKKWKRIPRPLGPGNVAKGLLSCLPKLDELREHGISTKSDTQAEGSEIDKQSKALMPGSEDPSPNEMLEWAMEKLQLSDSPTAATPTSKPGSAPSTASHKVNPASLPKTTAQPPNIKPKKGDSEEQSGTSLLIVDDNSMNLKLLGTFFKKNGYRNCEQATDGAEALGKVQQRPEGFEIILMGMQALCSFLNL